MGCFSGCLMSAASDQKLFCKLCSPVCCSFDEFVEEKVISASYSSAILTPPCRWILYQLNHKGNLRIPDWVAYPFSSRSSQPGIKLASPEFQADSLPMSTCYSVQFSSVTQSCLTLCDPMDCSTPGLLDPHHLPKFAQVHVHCIGEAVTCMYLTSSHPFI